MNDVKSWIDFACYPSEEVIKEELAAMQGQERADLRDQLCSAIGLSCSEMEMMFIRLLIEKARPLALPERIWSRELDETWSVREETKKWLDSLGISPTEERVASLQDLYRRFAMPRADVSNHCPDLLRKQDFRCRLCGLKFFQDDLGDMPTQSPHGKKRTKSDDPLKPHWNRKTKKGNPLSVEPTVDHLWPVSLYGSNERTNLAVLCKVCNEGKANYMCRQQSKPAVGLPWRLELSTEGCVFPETFFAQIAEFPSCNITGKDWASSELTVRKRNANRPPVIGNLITVSIDL